MIKDVNHVAFNLKNYKLVLDTNRPGLGID